VIGTTEQYQFTSAATLDQGRFLSAAECESGRPACVIGSDIATNLFRQELPLGQAILIAKHEFEVVGVLSKQGGFSGAGGPDNSVIIPLERYLYTFDRNPQYQIQVKVKIWINWMMRGRNCAPSCGVTAISPREIGIISRSTSRTNSWNSFTKWRAQSGRSACSSPAWRCSWVGSAS
jgi:hypothetical protein